MSEEKWTLIPYSIYNIPAKQVVLVDNDMTRPLLAFLGWYGVSSYYFFICFLLVKKSIFNPPLTQQSRIKRKSFDVLFSMGLSDPSILWGRGTWILYNFASINTIVVGVKMRVRTVWKGESRPSVIYFADDIIS